MKNAGFAGLGCCAFVLAATGPANAGEIFPTPTATVDVVPTQVFVPVFRPGALLADEAIIPPSHPPFDQIPPMPLPNPDWDIPDNLGGPGDAVMYDQRTGQTFVTPFYALGLVGGERGGSNYVGADGDAGWEDVYGLRGFSSMTVIPDSTINLHPWRMNTKLVMEFVDSGNGARSYFVGSGGMQDAEVVLTAGHCVYERGNDSTGADFGFASRIWVYPGWDGEGQTLGTPGVLQWYGWGQSEGLATSTGWTVDGNFDWDMGLIRIDRAVGMLTGWYAWRWGNDCTTRFYYNASYPAEYCGQPGLHNGRDMYYWAGHFDSCPGNQMRLNTTAGCFTTGWGGMSGSNAYDLEGSTRSAHSVSSNSNRADETNYCTMWESFKNYIVDTFEPVARGTSFDLQSLQTRYAESVVDAGGQLTGGGCEMPNPTNADPGSGTYSITIYLSANNSITTADTPLGYGNYTWDYAPMQNVHLNLGGITIPSNTPSGTYWIGVMLDNGQDANNANNDASLWDAHQVVVTGYADPRANSCTAPNGTFYHGDTIGVGYNVTNSGGDPSNNVTVDVYASTNTIITPIDIPLGSVDIGTLTAGQTKTGTLDVTLPAALNGNYYIGYIVNSSDDANLGNNTAYDSTAISVSGRSDLRVVRVLVYYTWAAQGGTLQFEVDLINDGTIGSGPYIVDAYASTDTTITPADTPIGSFDYYSLGAHATYVSAPTADIPPDLAPGDYYLGVIVSPGINETNLSNNTMGENFTFEVIECPADLNKDGLQDLQDIILFGSMFQGQGPAVDYDDNGVWDLRDIIAFIDYFLAGCR
ncbi:MAG: hypothetical protein H6810_04455 [Phycisphaeraceae bacterium]|nr:MAG: hypothetical protein H6810_04455 [Phycisphaeraceae bacterium]